MIFHMQEGTHEVDKCTAGSCDIACRMCFYMIKPCLLAVCTAHLDSFATMSQSLLRDAWLAAPAGRLSAWQQARALALRDVSKELRDVR